MVHILKYISDSKILDLKYNSDMNNAPVYDLLIQAIIKTENHLINFSDSSWKYCPDTGRSTGAYIIYYQGGTIDHGTHVTGQVYQSTAESEYNTESTAGIALTHFRMLIHEFLNKDPDVVIKESPLIILNSKSAMFMANNGKGTFQG